MASVPIILDCDPGHDDALAIVLALARPELRLLAITTVAGNAPLDRTTRNALRVLTLLERTDVPVAAGADRPLVRQPWVPVEFHGDSGLDGADLPEPAVAAATVGAVELTSQLLRDAPESVTLVATGPLTNVALLLRAAPSLRERIATIAVMGGSLGEGNTTAAAEFNIWADPEAAAIVFDSGIPIRMCGLDVTHQALVLPTDVARLQGLGNRAGRVFADLMRFFAIHHRERYDWDGPPIHDAVAVAWLAVPDLVRSRSIRIDVETDGTHTRGRTVADPEGLTGRSPNVDLGLDIDRERLIDLVVDAVGAFPVSVSSTGPASGVTPADVGFRPTDPAFIADPYPVFRRLRDEHPVLWNPDTHQWLVSRHADVNRLLRDRRLGRTYLHQASHADFGRADPPAWHAPFHDLNDAGMLDLEPPDHTRLRRLVLQAFTPRTVEAMRGRIEGIVDGLIDDFAGVHEIDLIADFVEPLPVTVIAELLGVPETDRHLLRPWSADICLMYELDPPEASARKAVQASLEFSAYLRDLLADRRAHPGDDLISGLAGVMDDGDTLTEDELIATCVLLLNAGHEASVNGAGNGWWTLFQHPDQLTRLRGDPGLLPTAIEELLRFDTPLPLFERWVLEPIEVDGVSIPRGDEVALLFGSANRDPLAFDRPNDLDLGRSPNPYLAFGAGIHYCLGAPLAKLELSIAFGTLLRRVPRLELVEAPRWKSTFVLRGLEALHVRV